MNNDRTLSGIDSQSRNHLFLPSSVSALIVGGDNGQAGQVLAKSSENKLQWDFVDDIEIPDNSITGAKLRNDITFATSGNITLYRDPSLGAGNSLLTAQNFTTTSEVNLKDDTTTYLRYNPNDLTGYKLRLSTDLGGTNNIVLLDTFTQTATKTLTLNIGATIPEFSTNGRFFSSGTSEGGNLNVNFLDIAGNALFGKNVKINGDLEVVGDIELDTLDLTTLDILGRIDFEIRDASDPRDPTLDRRYLRIRDNGDMFWYKNFLFNSGTPDQTQIASFTRRTPTGSTDDVIDLTTNGRVFFNDTTYDINNPSVNVGGYSKFTNRVDVDFLTTLNTTGFSAIFSKDISVGKDTTSGNGVLSLGDIDVRGDETIVGGVQDLRKIIIRNKLAGDEPTTPPTIRFEVDNDSIKVVKDIDATGHIIATDKIQTGLEFLGYDFLNEEDVFKIRILNGDGYIKKKFMINAISSPTHHGTSSFQIGGTEFNTTGRLLDYIISIPNATNVYTTSLKGYGTEQSGDEMDSWTIDTTIDKGQEGRVRAVSTSKATFNTINITGDFNLDASGNPVNPSRIKGQLIIQPETTSQTEDVEFRSALGNDFLYKKYFPNLSNTGGSTLGVGATNESGNVFYNALSYSTDNNGQMVSFGGTTGTAYDAHPIKITEVDRPRISTNSENAGGIVFGNQHASIRGYEHTNDQEVQEFTRCFNLDLTDPSNKLSTLERTDKICLTRLFPSTAIDFPKDVTGYEWNDDQHPYDFISLDTDAYVEIPSALTGSDAFDTFLFEWSIYVEEAIWGDDNDGSTSGNRDMFYRIAYTSSTDSPPYSVIHNLTQTDHYFMRSGNGNEGLVGSNNPNKLYGGGYNLHFKDVCFLPVFERSSTIRVYPQLRNQTFDSNQSPALINIQAGGGNQSDKQPIFIQASPLNNSLVRNVTS